MKILFVGDIMQHQPQIDFHLKNGGYLDENFKFTFEHVIDIFKSVDLRIGNLETTFSGKPYVGYPRFSAPDEFLNYIKWLNFDCLTLANNHINDYGSSGIYRTLDLLNLNGIKYVGVDNKNIILESKNGPINIYNSTCLSNRKDSLGVVSMFNNVESQKAFDSNCVNIAFTHFGKEYHRIPNDAQMNIFDAMEAQGYKALFGCHPHVVQPHSHNTKAKKFFSLGNFLSYQALKQPQNGLMIILEIEDGEIQAYETIATCSYNYENGSTKIFTEKTDLSAIEDRSIVNTITSSLNEAVSICKLGLNQF